MDFEGSLLLGSSLCHPAAPLHLYAKRGRKCGILVSCAHAVTADPSKKQQKRAGGASIRSYSPASVTYMRFQTHGLSTTGLGVTELEGKLKHLCKQPRESIFSNFTLSLLFIQSPCYLYPSIGALALIVKEETAAACLFFSAQN